MFDNPRYLTRGVNTNISLFLQTLLWDMIDEMQIKKDYLQVFKLIPVEIGGETVLKIVHTQEKPSYERTVILSRLTQPIQGKIFVIDDGNHSTMMLAEEF